MSDQSQDNSERVHPIRDLSTAQRTAEGVLFTIDPGFVNERRFQTVFGEEAIKVVDDILRSHPGEEWQRRLRSDHAHKNVALKICEILKAPTLRSLIHEGRGRIFCSIEELSPLGDDVWEADDRRLRADVVLRDMSMRAALEFSSQHIHSDTFRMELGRGGRVAIVASLDRREGETLVFAPIVMGAPWLSSDSPEFPADEAMWWARDYLEVLPQDVKQFERIVDVPVPASPEPMREIPERGVKAAIAQLLGDAAEKDWGGEQSDYFSAHLQLGSRDTTAAFLLKGPAHFAPMGLNHLGKNNDQIVRLSHSPANLLVLQHCHDILPAVRDTLRVFAAQPSRPRYYMFMDGRTTLQLLTAYGLMDLARSQ